MEDPTFMHQWELSSLDHDFTRQNMWGDFNQTLFPESYPSFPSFPSSTSIQSNTFSGSSMESPRNTSRVVQGHNMTPGLLSFGNPGLPGDRTQVLYENLDGFVKPKEEMVQFDTMMVGEGLKRPVRAASNRLSSLGKEHVIAERKRREKITRRLIALSAMIPGLKKLDKATVLMEATRYMKQLQEKVKALEEQAAKGTVESAVLARKSNPSNASNEVTADGHLYDNSLPEIEARLSEKKVLVKIHCENRKGLLVKALSEIENLHMSVVNTSVVPFGSSFLDIIVVAQIEEGFSMTVKDLVKKLNSAFRKFK